MIFIAKQIVIRLYTNLSKTAGILCLTTTTELPQKRRLSSQSYNIRADVFLMWIQNQTSYNLLFVMKYFRFIYN